MKKLYILLIVVFAILTAEAQDGIKCLAKIDTVYLNIDSLYYIKCNGTDQIMNNSVWERYRNLNMYIPDMDTSQPLHVPPIKTIRVNINIIQKDDGTCNFQNTYETRRRMRQILSYIQTLLRMSSASVSHKIPTAAPSKSIPSMAEWLNHKTLILKR